MRSIYIEYLDQANKLEKKCNEIYTCALELEQELHISNIKTKQVVSILE